MSGAEIGLVLAIIPLCIAAAEHYEDVLKPFKRYRNYSIEVERFQDELTSQQVIFESELELLLSHVSSWDIAEAMVQDRDHPQWKGQDMEEKLSTWLGKSHLACKNTIRLICEDLSNIRKEASFFDTDTKDSAIPTDSSQKRSYKQRIGRKLKWSLSKSQLQRILEDLQYHVEVFRRHTGQASSIMEKRQNIKQKNTTPEKFKTENIAETHIVHKAAVELYQALILACKLHREHKLHFRLETRNCSNNEGSFIRFHLGYIPSLPSSGVRPFWVAVESEYGTTRMTMSNSNLNTGFVPQLGLNNLLKRAYEVPLSTPQKRKKKATDRKVVHFENSAGTPATSPGNKSRNLKSCLLPAFLSPSSEDTPIVTDAIQGSAHSPICPIPSMPKQTTSHSKIKDLVPVALPDFCQQQNLCSHIAEHSKTNCKTDEGCIGYLGRESTNNRRVLISPSESQDQTKAVSLAELISSSVGLPRSRRFLYLDSIRLAKRLASAILTYHSTPMLEESWQSQDIILYEDSKEAKGCRVSLANPHLSVHMMDRETPNSQSLGQSRSLPRDKSIRNIYTYRLGVILLELAYQTPLSKLQEEEEAITNPESPSTEFEAAKLMSETISTDMGIPFQKIVQRCLNCDFGSGTDLRSADLQAAFRRDIVCELEGIEGRLSALQLEC